MTSATPAKNPMKNPASSSGTNAPTSAPTAAPTPADTRFTASSRAPAPATLPPAGGGRRWVLLVNCLRHGRGMRGVPYLDRVVGGATRAWRSVGARRALAGAAAPGPGRPPKSRPVGPVGRPHFHIQTVWTSNRRCRGGRVADGCAPDRPISSFAVPLYEFACAACGERFEALAAPSERPHCPACGAVEPRRLYSPISPPPRLGLRGAAARRSNALRRAREEQRRERREQRRERAQDG